MQTWKTRPFRDSLSNRENSHKDQTSLRICRLDFVFLYPWTDHTFSGKKFTNSRGSGLFVIVRLNVTDCPNSSRRDCLLPDMLQIIRRTEKEWRIRISWRLYGQLLNLCPFILVECLVYTSVLTVYFRTREWYNRNFDLPTNVLIRLACVTRFSVARPILALEITAKTSSVSRVCWTPYPVRCSSPEQTECGTGRGGEDVTCKEKDLHFGAYFWSAHFQGIAQPLSVSNSRLTNRGNV